MRLTADQKQEIIRAYTLGLESTGMIAKRYRVTPQSISYTLRKAGVEVNRGRLTVQCDNCGKDITKSRALVRKNKRNYCNADCRNEHVRSADLSRENWMMRRARKYVSDFYNIKFEEVVFALDGNIGNMTPENIVVFRNIDDRNRFVLTGGPVDVFSIEIQGRANLFRKSEAEEALVEDTTNGWRPPVAADAVGEVPGDEEGEGDEDPADDDGPHDPEGIYGHQDHDEEFEQPEEAQDYVTDTAVNQKEEE